MSRSFDGIDDFLDLGNGTSGSDLKPTSPPYWACFWLKVNNVTARHEILSCEEPGIFGYEISFRGDVAGDPMEIGFFSTQFPVFQAGTLVANRWYFVAAGWLSEDVNGDDNYAIVIDGTKTTGGVADNTVIYGTTAVRVGLSPTNTRDLNGFLAHLHIYTGVFLSDSEIQQIRRFPGSIRRGLKCYLPLWGGSPELDYSGRGNHGTVTGATVSADNPPVNGVFRIPKPELIHAF